MQDTTALVKPAVLFNAAESSEIVDKNNAAEWENKELIKKHMTLVYHVKVSS